MRLKNDICIKMYQLANTIFLSDEQFGILIRKIMIDDDVNNQRYENLDGVILSSYKAAEKKWLQKYEDITAQSPLMLQAYNTLHGQACQSRKAFNKKCEAIENKKQEAQQNEEETITARINEIDEEQKIIFTDTGEVIKYNPEDEKFGELGYYQENRIKLKMITENSELIEYKEI